MAVRFANGGSRPQGPRSGSPATTRGGVGRFPYSPVVTNQGPAPEACAHLREDALRLLAGWSPPTAGVEATRRRFLDLLESAPEAARPDNPGAHLTASTLIVSAGLDRALLCLHGRMHRWVQVGGHCEDSDVTIAHAALREATEESGIAGLRLHPDPIDLDIHVVNCRHGPASHFDVRFAAIAPPGAEAVVSAESRDVRWFAPDALPSPLASATDRLIAPAFAAARRLAVQS